MGAQQARKSDVHNLSQRRDPIVLRWQDDSRMLVVEPKDQDRYMLTVSKAIAACQMDQALGLEQFQTQFKNLLLTLKNWAQERRNEIEGVYLAVRDGGLLYVVVKKQARFNPDFEDSLTDLDLKIAHDEDLSMMRVNMLSLPKASMDAISTFLSPIYTLKLELPDAN
jgi:hypothetical protein